MIAISIIFPTLLPAMLSLDGPLQDLLLLGLYFVVVLQVALGHPI